MAPSPFKKPHPAGGAVEIGKILLKTDGVIESDQMNLIADTLARLETGLAAVDLDSMAATPTLARFEFVVTYVRTCVRGVVVLG